MLNQLTSLAEPGAGEGGVGHEGDGDEGFEQPHDDEWWNGAETVRT